MNSRIVLIGILGPLVVLAGCSGKKDEAEPAGASHDQAELVAPSEEVSTADVRNLDALVDLVVAEAAALPRAEFDPAALAEKLGSDPRAQFEWVRDRTWWAPYRGLLRGSQGVMLDRVGSSLDRSVLLGDLLRRSGHTVRLAHAIIPSARAQELVSRVRPIPDQRVGPRAEGPVASDRQRKFESLFPGYGEPIQREVGEARRLAGEATALVRTQAGQLLAAVRSAATGARKDDAVAAMQDHWWVERLEGGRWIAMDVLLPDSKPGDALTVASGTNEWKSSDAFPLVPDSNWHAVQVRVIVERYEGGKTSESTALETTLRPAEVLDRPIAFRHLPDPWPESMPSPKDDPNALGNAAVNVRMWVPYLQIGDQLVVQSAFTEGGDLEQAPFSSQKDISEVGGGSLFGGFDDALSGSAAGNTSHVTAEWLELEIRGPGQEKQLLRRPLFDLLGPARRATRADDFDPGTNDLMVERYEALLSSTEILLQVCDFTGDYVSSLRLAGVVANQDDLRKLSRETDAVNRQTLARTVYRRIAGWSTLPDVALWRSSLAQKPGERFIDRPNVLSYRVTRPIVAADQLPIRELVDVAFNSTGARPGDSAFEARLQQGVADTFAEMLVMTDQLGSTGNTASVFMAEGGGFEGGILVRPRDLEAVQKLGWPDDVAARLLADVGAGYVALVPGKAALVDGRERLGWWRVDPASGETIGVMDTGFNTATGEKASMDDLMETMGVRLQQYERAERNWAATAQDFVQRPGVTSLGPQDMQRLVIYQRVCRILDTMGLALL